MLDTDGTTLFPNAPFGTEDLGVSSCEKKQYKKNCENVTQYSLDTFVKQHIAKAPSENSVMIDFLSIDVEGFDLLVLKGATKTLPRTKYLEFEYNSVGAWKQQNLSTAIDLLGGAGFQCYWAGKEGRLWRITNCWMDSFNQLKQWSNVACVHLRHAPTLARRMEGRFLHTLQTFVPLGRRR